MREIRYIDAIREALAEESRRDETVFVMGETLVRGGSFKETRGLWAEFGDKRVIDTPISEVGFTGTAIGAAMTGLRPVIDYMFWDFCYDAMSQIVQNAARIHYLSNGNITVPMVVLAMAGAANSAGGHHSSLPYPLFTQMPGLKVVLPFTPYDAKGLLKTAIRDDNPVLMFPHRGLVNTTGLVPEDEYTIPLGQAVVRRAGTDVTVVATLKMVSLALQAAEQLSSAGISVEVVDPRTLVPLDKKTILESICKTQRLLVVDEAFCPCGVGSEIAALAADEAFFYLDAPIKRVHSLCVPMPFSPPLEQAVLPNCEQIVAAIKQMVTPKESVSAGVF
jgi:pyruvate dehydrogenase E1 component beta subunit